MKSLVLFSEAMRDIDLVVSLAHAGGVDPQARGCIFLPFAEDDPKSQEIISKILLLAEDKKIKDPEILRQLSWE